MSEAMDRLEVASAGLRLTAALMELPEAPEDAKLADAPVECYPGCPARGTDDCETCNTRTICDLGYSGRRAR